jgi:hypothetical protein
MSYRFEVEYSRSLINDGEAHANHDEFDEYKFLHDCMPAHDPYFAEGAWQRQLATLKQSGAPVTEKFRNEKRTKHGSERQKKSALTRITFRCDEPFL